MDVQRMNYDANGGQIMIQKTTIVPVKDGYGVDWLAIHTDVQITVTGPKHRPARSLSYSMLEVKRCRRL